MAKELNPIDSAAGQFLLQMKQSGVDHVLTNAGTDFPSLI